MHKKALVLNADYSPIGIIEWSKAVVLDFKGAVKVVDFYKNDFIQCTGNLKWPVPAVVVLTKYKKYTKKIIPFSRKNVFIRDKLRCQYCGKRFRPDHLTYDHVIPRAKWTKPTTPTCWENIVSCCYPCNKKKGDKLLSECDMSLIRQPKRPTSHGFIIGLSPWTTIQKEWIPYLPREYTELLQKKGV